MIERPDKLARRQLLGGLTALNALYSARSFAGLFEPRPPPLRSPTSQFVEVQPLVRAPDVALDRIDGRRVQLSRFHGRVVLINFWATWCPPCRRELPMLDNLVRITAGSSLAVVAVSIDQAPRSTVSAFIKDQGVSSLMPYVDPQGALASPARANGSAAPFVLWGMPISYIIDRLGRIAGYITGEVDWAAEEGRAFLAYYAGQ